MSSHDKKIIMIMLFECVLMLGVSILSHYDIIDTIFLFIAMVWYMVSTIFHIVSIGGPEKTHEDDFREWPITDMFEVGDKNARFKGLPVISLLDMSYMKFDSDVFLEYAKEFPVVIDCGGQTFHIGYGMFSNMSLVLLNVAKVCGNLLSSKHIAKIEDTHYFSKDEWLDNSMKGIGCSISEPPIEIRVKSLEINGVIGSGDNIEIIGIDTTRRDDFSLHIFSSNPVLVFNSSLCGDIVFSSDRGNTISFDSCNISRSSISTENVVNFVYSRARDVEVNNLCCSDSSISGRVNYLRCTGGSTHIQTKNKINVRMNGGTRLWLYSKSNRVLCDGGEGDEDLLCEITAETLQRISEIDFHIDDRLFTFLGIDSHRDALVRAIGSVMYEHCLISKSSDGLVDKIGEVVNSHFSIGDDE